MAKQPKQSLYEAFSKQLKPQVSTTLSNLKPVVNDRPTTSKPLQNLSNAPVRTQEDIGKKTQARSPQRTFENPPMENRSTVQEERPIPKVLQKGKSPQPGNDAIRIQDQLDRPTPTAKPSLDGQLQINQNRQFSKPVTTPQSQSQQCFKQEQQLQAPITQQRQQQSQQQQYQQQTQQQSQQSQRNQQPQSRQPQQQQQLPQQQVQQTKLSLQSNQPQVQTQRPSQQQVQQRPQTQQSQTQLRSQPPPQQQYQQPLPQQQQPPARQQQQVQQKQQPQQQTYQQPQQQQKKPEAPRQIQEFNQQPQQQFNPQPQMIPEEPQDTRLFECPEGCGRSFNAKALEKHAKVCKKVFQEKRKVFDSQQQRILDEEEAQFKAPPPPPSKKQQQQKKPQQQQKQDPTPKWKAQSEAFRAIIKQGKGKELTAQEQAQLKNAMEASQDLVQCKFCNRKFNAETAKKHIAFCETKAKQAVSQKKKK